MLLETQNAEAAAGLCMLPIPNPIAVSWWPVQFRLTSGLLTHGWLTAYRVIPGSWYCTGIVQSGHLYSKHILCSTGNKSPCHFVDLVAQCRLQIFSMLESCLLVSWLTAEDVSCLAQRAVGRRASWGTMLHLIDKKKGHVWESSWEG